MANLKSLFKDTAIYGLSSIVGRFLNYLLVPLYSYKLSAASGDYGIVTNVYSYTALLLVLLTFGMETTFFRFVNKENENPERVYSTTLIAVGGVGLMFVAAVLCFLPTVAGWMGYASTPQYVGIMAVVVALDAFQAIPFAYLRYKRQPLKFAGLKLLFIFLNILLNLIYFLGTENPDVGFVFYINLICTASITLFFWRELTGFRWVADTKLLRRMLSYAWPLVILGVAGILNQTADKILYPIVRGGLEGKVELGIYGACVKVAMIMAMITQAFRYAYEPFVFAGSKDKESRETYAKAMKYFIAFTLLAFLVVMGYIDILKYIIGPDYWEGLRVIPIVMVAEIMMGVYFNLSFWYKLTDRTIWGALLSGAGCLVLIVVNVVFIPHYHYMACAWAGVAGYGTAMVLSYFTGQHYFPIKYPLKDIGIYILIAALFYALMQLIPADLPLVAKLALNTVLICAFAAHIIYHDLPLREMPFVGKYFRK
ncbi:MAG: lipopolysaccharide biosynthesis protein [Alloprevotella sp.]|nr:lipopolysaccharide biosynthesis protein [Alloprevotella sp.]